jgi:hypothetical protein
VAAFFLNRDGGGLVAAAAVPSLVLPSGFAALRSLRGGLLSAAAEDMALGSLRGISPLSRGAASVFSGAEGGRGSDETS